MNKISEKLDLSRKVLDIDIESPVFNCMLHDLNMEIERVIKQVYDEKFEGGEITLKLSIEIPNGYETIPKTDEFGEMINETYKYRKPVFEHKVTTTLKKQYKNEGIFNEKRDIQFKDGKFIAVPIKRSQMHIDDLIQISNE
ncbi:hypothetical protein [Clostridium sp. UBA1056]|uniref:hypothetical protein n=1 Tax=unclassified Clostridium TaxID=2614128 RepID=UPI003217C093